MSKAALQRIADNLPCYLDADGAIRASVDHTQVKMHRKTLAGLIMGCKIAVDADRRVSLTDAGRAVLRARRSNRSYYQARKAAGDIQVTLWVPAGRVEELKKYAAGLS
jgi:hypothetical protein